MQNVIKIIARLKEVFGSRTDTELAKYLGLSQSTIASWKARDTIDWELIITKCNNVNLNWLIWGIGKKFLHEEINQVNENKMQYQAKIPDSDDAFIINITIEKKMTLFNENLLILQGKSFL